MGDILGHELGHFLGMGHPPGSCGPGLMMTPAAVDSDGNMIPKSTSAAECELADELNELPDEPPPPPPTPCESDEICIEDIIGDIDVCDLLPEACELGVIWVSRQICVSRVQDYGFGSTIEITCSVVSILDPDNPPRVLSGIGPLVTLSSPTENQVMSGIMEIRGTAATPTGVHKIAAWIDGEPANLSAFGWHRPATSSPCQHPEGIDPDCPRVGFSGFLDTSQLANGTHELVLMAIDERNYPLMTAIKRTFTVDNGCTDTTPPIVTPITPLPNSTVQDQVPIEVAVDDDADVDRMRIFVDGQMLALLHAPPWRTTWDASGLAPGSLHEVLVRAVDGCENVAPRRWSVSIYEESPPDPCTSDATPPTLVLTSPSPGTTTLGAVSIVAAASDASGIARVEFLVDGTLVHSDASAPYAATWDASTAASGEYALEARAVDACGHVSSRQVMVTVTHAPIGWLDAPRHQEVMSGLAAPIVGWALGDGGLESFWMSIDGQVPVAQIGSFSRGSTRAGACAAYAWLGDPACPAVGIDGTFDTTGLANGAHTLRMSMTGANGLTHVFSRSFQVDNPTPQGWVHVPAHHQTLAGSAVTVYGWALGAGGLDDRRVLVDGVPLDAVTFDLAWQGACDVNHDVPDPTCPLVGWSATLDTTTLADGPHTMTLTGTDASGRSLTFERQFFVDQP
ncbi:MAG: Ig-like domain-containing protein [Acidobacteriota bacterium]